MCTVMAGLVLVTSAFTRVHSASQTRVNALKDALCPAMTILARQHQTSSNVPVAGSRTVSFPVATPK